MWRCGYHKGNDESQKDSSSEEIVQVRSRIKALLKDSVLSLSENPAFWYHKNQYIYAGRTSGVLSLAPLLLTKQLLSPQFQIMQEDVVGHPTFRGDKHRGCRVFVSCGLGRQRIAVKTRVQDRKLWLRKTGASAYKCPVRVRLSYTKSKTPFYFLE